MLRQLKPRVFLAALVAVLFFGPSLAWGYIGPGAGVAAAGTIFVLIGAFFAAFAALIAMPIRSHKAESMSWSSSG